MTDLHYDDWMSESDSVLWHIERDPLLRSTIMSVWLLDSVPDRERMDLVLERIVANVPRLRQRVIDHSPGIAPPRWEDDPDVDVDYHYDWIRLPGRRVGLPEVLAHARRMAGRSFDKDRPLWELAVIEGLAGKRAAFVMKVHHAIADGLGMVQLLQHMVDLEADPTIGAPAAATDRDMGDIHAGGADTGTSTGTGTDAQAIFPELPQMTAPLWAIPGARSVGHRIATEAKTGVRIGRASLRTAGELLTNPRRTIEQLGRTTGSIARVVQPATTPRSPLMTERSLNPQLDVLTVRFRDMRATARVVDGTVNDVFVTATLDALDRYHRDAGVECAEVRMNMPVSIRGGDAANHFDNQFVPTRMLLPLGGGDAQERLRAVKASLRDVRAEPALPHVNDISGVIARLGPAAAVSVLGAMLKGVDITTSNVPGPPFPVWMAGSKVDEFYAFGPLAGSAVNVTLFSYDGAVHLGVTTDRAAIPDHDRFMSCLSAAVDELISLAADRGDHDNPRPPVEDESAPIES